MRTENGSRELARPCSFPILKGFFSRCQVFHVYIFHKPAKTSIIVPKLSSFLVDSDATFDIGGSCNVDWKWSSWVGPGLLPCFEGFFQLPQALPKPALSYQNSIAFYWIQTQRLTSVGVEMWTENDPRESAPAMLLPCFKGFFFKKPEVFHGYNSHKPFQNQYYRTKTF